MTETEVRSKFGEVYKCAFYLETVGSEVKGYRPVLIISAQWYNEESERITVLPLTRAFNKKGQEKYVYVWEVQIKVNNKEGKVMTDQIHNIDKQRLEKKIGDLSGEKLIEVMEKLGKLINFSPKKAKVKL